MKDMAYETGVEAKLAEIKKMPRPEPKREEVTPTRDELLLDDDVADLWDNVPI